MILPLTQPLTRAGALLCLFCGGLFAAGEGGAQSRSNQRSEQVTGMRAGAFIFSPVIAGSERYDSNIFQERSGETDSFISTLTPRLSVESDFSRHRIELDAGVAKEFFHDSPADDTLTYDAGLDGTLDITRRLRFNAGVGYRRLAERRGSDEVGLAFSGPIYNNTFGAEARLQYLPGDFRIEPFVAASRRDFVDRDGRDQDERDRLTLEGGLEVGYRLRTGFEAFVVGRYFTVDFDDTTDNAGFNRDSSGYEAFAGLNLKLSRLVVGTVGAGFVASDFEDPALVDTTDVTVRAGVAWNPTRRLDFDLRASRAIDQTSVAGATDKVLTDAVLTARYEILRNLDGSLASGVARREFNGINRTDTGYFGQAALDWAVTRRTSLRLSYIYFKEDSTDPVHEYDKHVVSLGLAYGF